MNLETVYNYLREIRQTIIDYINKNNNKNEPINFMLSNKQLAYSFDGYKNVNIGKDEADMIAHYLNQYFGFSNRYANGNEEYYNLTLKNVDMLLNSNLCNDFQSFKKTVEKNKESYEHQMLGVIRDLAATNNRDASRLYFSIDDDHLYCSGDGIELNSSKHRKKLLFDLLKKYGVTNPDYDKMSVTILDPSLFWKDTCKDGEYNISNLVNIIVQSAGKSNLKSSSILIRDFSISVNGKVYYFENGLSESTKMGLVSELYRFYEAKVEKVGNDYLVSVLHFADFLEPEEGTIKR